MSGIAGPAALVRHVHEIHARALLEELAREVRGPADAGRAVFVLAGIRLHQRDELLQVLRRHAGMHDRGRWRRSRPW
jgi:hypothetical protein